MAAKLIHAVMAWGIIGAWGCLGIWVLLWNWFLRWAPPWGKFRQKG